MTSKDDWELPDLPTEPLWLRQWLANAILFVCMVAVVFMIGQWLL